MSLVQMWARKIEESPKQVLYNIGRNHLHGLLQGRLYCYTSATIAVLVVFSDPCTAKKPLHYRLIGSNVE